MNTLDKICDDKRAHINRNEHFIPQIVLEERAKLQLPPVGFCKAILAKRDLKEPALIAEVKKASPSKGVFREDFNPVAIAQSYQKGGASCLSVLTDVKFFQGSFENLSLVRSAVDLPLLCKDFIIYPYQMYWARIHGADRRT